MYHAVKWGLHGWSEGMSYELAPFGIGIKTVAPGFIRTEFGSNLVITSTEPYIELMERYLQAVNSMMDPESSGSTAEEIAEIVYQAAIDGKDQVHYTAGSDSKQMSDRRLEIGAESSRREMSTLFLG